MRVGQSIKLKSRKMVSCQYEDGVFVAEVDYIDKSVFDKLPKRAKVLLKEAGFEIIDRIVIE